MGQSLPLSALRVGESAVVVRLTGGQGLLSRMASMGFTPGVDIQVLQNYGSGPLIAIVRNARIALGRSEANKVYVRVYQE